MKASRFIKRNAIAIVALVFAMTGTGIAASRYIITSTSQIKPSVLKELRAGPAYAAEVKPAKSGAHAIVARPQLESPFVVLSVPPGVETWTSVPLVGATWTQHAEEVQAIIGGLVRLHNSSSALSCTPEIRLYLDGQQIGSVRRASMSPGETASWDISWANNEGNAPVGEAWWIAEAASPVTHTITASAINECGRPGGQPMTIEVLRLSVIGLK